MPYNIISVIEKGKKMDDKVRVKLLHLKTSAWNKFVRSNMEDRKWLFDVYFLFALEFDHYE